MIDMTIPGQMSRYELETLELLARQVPENGIVVELGALYGRSSFAWGTTVPSNAAVYCIDPWKRDGWIIDLVERKTPECPPFSFEEFKRNVYGVNTIKPIVGRSPDDIQFWSKKVDVYFDDSMHHNPYFRKNLYFWLMHMKPGGIMCGHDYCAEWPDVRYEVDRLARFLDVSVNVCEWVWWLRLPRNLPMIRRSIIRLRSEYF